MTMSQAERKEASGAVIDPVCGMTVDPAARPELQLEHLGRTFYFCSKGCLLDFRDEPDKFLDPGYQPREM